MRKNMECNENHKNVSIPNNIRTKLKMLGTVAALSSLAVVTFSGCGAEREEIVIIPTSSDTSYISQMSEEETTKRFDEYYEQVTEFEENQEEEFQEEEYQEEDYQEEQYQEEEEFEECEDNEYEEYDNTEYGKLSSRLQSIINKKGTFDNEIKMLLEEILERLYNNYSTWQQGYENMPSTNDYIQSNFLDVLENDVADIEFVDEDSKEGQKLINDGYPAGYTKVDNGKYYIRMIIPKKGTTSIESRYYTIEELFHEIIHCKEGKITFNSDYFDGHEDLIDIYTEGAATFHQKFTNEFTTESFGMWSISNESGTKTIDYTKENGVGYLVQLNAYEKLIYLLGYNFMNQVEKGDIPFSQIRNEMKSKYGENGTQLFDQMERWYTNYREEGWRSDVTFNSSVKLENLFLELAKKDRNKNKINHYLEKNLPTVTDSNGRNITDQIFNTGRNNDNLR